MAVSCYRHRWYRVCHPRSYILNGGGAPDPAYTTLFDGILRRHRLDHGHR